jgi:hypothetical protein
MLEAHGELLPLATDDGGDLVVLNVTTVLDALDEERSSVQRFPSTQRIPSLPTCVRQLPPGSLV